MKLRSILLLAIILSSQAVAQNPLPHLLSRLKRTARDTGQVVVLSELAAYYQNFKPDSSGYFAKQGLQLSEKLHYIPGSAIFNRILGELNMNQGKIADAHAHFETALAGFDQTNDQKGIASVYNGLGILAARQGNYKEALPPFLKALSVYEKTNDTNGIVQSYIKLGSVNLQTGKLDKALDFYFRGMRLVKSEPVSNAFGTLINDIGITYIKKNEPHKALDYLRAGLHKVTDQQLTDVRILLLINTGEAYEKLHNAEAALLYENEALQLVRKMHLRELEVNTLVNLSSLLNKTKPDTSAKMLRQALAIAKEINQQYLMLDVYQGMVDLYKQQRNYRAAEQTLEKRNLLQDSLFTLKLSKELAGLQSNYDLSKASEKVQELIIRNQRIAYNRNIILAVAISIFILLLIVLVYYKKTTKLNEELQASEEVLRQQKEALDEENEFKNKLFSIIGHDLRSPVATIVNMMEIAESNNLSAKEFIGFVPQLKDQSKATLETLDKLLIWGKSQLKGKNHNPIVFNAKELVLKNRELYKNPALQKAIAVSDNTPDEVLMYADIAYVDFIIRNLLANAIKYTHIGGEIKISARLNQPAGFNAIHIDDNGIGIAKEAQRQVFEQHNKSQEGTANEKGNSIGLMLCKTFAEANGGKIELESELGVGTRFTFYFPFA
jgi:signal transduction histidine kinase